MLTRDAGDAPPTPSNYNAEATWDSKKHEQPPFSRP